MDRHIVMRAPLFAALDEETAWRLMDSMSPHQLSRGDVVFDEGDPGDSLYVITSGKVKLARTSGDGRESLLSVLGPGEMFGELSLFDPGPRLTTAYVVSDTEFIALGNEALRDFLTDHPEVAMRMLAGLARRLRRSNEGISDLVFTDVPGRVAKALLDLSDRFGKRTETGLLVAHDLTQEELAQLVGASRETVNKALADFAHRGWITLGAKSVTLLDLDRLKRRAR
ncbi:MULTISPECIES: Crp/Fnr family transcriptional regulator [unclassified Serinicoccus]|uniref:Crp/Fnr family transcriptional regulator n=1 Tax=unclassified Serinicoccus TaxID=2643101 RepID=UPI00385346CB